MDFGKILEEWESEHKEGATDAGRSSTESQHVPTSNELKRMSPQRSLDLHGYTAEEAKVFVLDFLKTSYHSGLFKVMIIHGKGYHSKDGKPVLQKVVYECLDSSPYAGKRGVPSPKHGGTGAVWVAIKKPAK